MTAYMAARNADARIEAAQVRAELDRWLEAFNATTAQLQETVAALREQITDGRKTDGRDR